MLMNFIPGANWDIVTPLETFFVGEYFGPWTDLDKAGEPINALDALAKTHDYRYAKGDRLGGRAGRIEKTKADYEMAFATDNKWVQTALLTQATIRVFTFNSFDLPW